MAASKEAASAVPIPMYAIAVNEAIASGDASKMAQAREAAFDYLANAAEVTRLLPALEKAIQAKGGVIRPLYGCAIQEAKARNDSTELARIKAELASYDQLLRADNHAHAATTVPPYGVAIQQAKARGDEAEVKRLSALAESLLAQLHAGK